MSATEDFISHLVLHFGEPKFDVGDFDKPKAYREWLRSLSRALSGFTPDCLKKASELVVQTRKYRSFPLVSECIDACNDAQKWINAQKPALALQDPMLIPQWSRDRTLLADDLVMGALGRRAANEGWISALHQFCRKEMRLPNDEEIKACIERARGFDEGLEMAKNGECGAQSHHVAQLGMTMLARRQELVDMVLHGVMKSA